MAKELDDHVKNTLNERYSIVLNSLKENRSAIEQMTAELLEIEVITGERVREIIKENGGTIFEDEDLHTEALSKDVEEKAKDKTDVDSLENSKEDVTENSDNNPNTNN